MKPFYITLIFCNFFYSLFAQNNSDKIILQDSLKGDGYSAKQSQQSNANPIGRKWLVGGVMTAGLGGSLVFNYKSMSYEYEKTFHRKNDFKAWKQMDKAQHAHMAYTVSRLSTGLWQWAGMTHNKAVLTGSSTAFAYLIIKEYIDGHNANGGWSWGDAGADLAGTAFFALQELAWKEQKLQLKVSTRLKTYDPSLKERTDYLYGTNTIKRLLKDYNAQTYWLSGNLQSILQIKKLPAWLNLSIGVGAEDMYGNYANVVYDDDEGNTSFDRSDIKRYRQWYLAPDIDLTRIKTNNKTLKTLFSIFNSIKVPAPALEISKGKLKGHLLYF